MRSGNSVVMILLFAVALGGVAVGAYFFGRSQISAPPASKNFAESSPTPTTLPNPITPTPAPATTTVVVFEASGSYPAGDKENLQKYIVDPFVDYYAQANMGVVVSLTISPNTQDNKSSYPYTAQGVFANGGYTGFVIEKSGNVFKWWRPECMGECPMSDDFKAKYPALVQ